MTEPWEARIFAVPDLGWQTHAPPDRHAVPARYVPGLEAGDEVTIGVPGRLFLDGQVLTSTERRPMVLAGYPDEQEALPVAAPFAYWLAQGFPQAGLTMQWWPVDSTWVYRDAVKPGDVPGGPAQPDDHPGTWLDHVRPTLDEPPVRHARPARDVGSLSGRTVRLQHERGAWSWWVAVSEPVDHDGDFGVQVMRPSEYWLAQAVFDAADQSRLVPLHRLFSYD